MLFLDFPVFGVFPRIFPDYCAEVKNTVNNSFTPTEKFIKIAIFFSSALRALNDLSYKNKVEKTHFAKYSKKVSYYLLLKKHSLSVLNLIRMAKIVSRIDKHVHVPGTS